MKPTTALSLPAGGKEPISFAALLEAINDLVSQRWWVLEGLDILGERGESLCRRLETFPSGRLLMDGSELLISLRPEDQVVDGSFFGFRSRDAALEAATSKHPLLEAEADVIVEATDGTRFYVLTDSLEVADTLKKRLHGARHEAPSQWFG